MAAAHERSTPDTLRLLSLVERAVTARLDEALRAHGADIDQWRILSLLAERGGCPMHVVGDHAMLLAPKLSKLVDRMVSGNLLLRRADEHDRRRVLVAATPRGRQALATWDAAATAVHQEFRDLLGPEAAVLDELLGRLAGGLTRSAVLR